MAYAETTKVAFEQSVMEIMKMIRRAGAEQVGQMEDTRFFAVQFTLANRMIRFRVPFPTVEDMPSKDGYGRPLPASKRGEKLEQAKRQKGRALMLVIKAKLESVESGVETIEQAFLANVVMSDGMTVYERIAGPMALEYSEGRPSAVQGLLPPPQSVQ
jgi:hypothetical protein